MPARIEVSSAAAGPAHYIFNVNPSVYEASDDVLIFEHSVLHGPSIWQKGQFDGRVRTMSWSGFPVAHASISPLVTYLRSVQGLLRYFNFKDLDSINEGWPVSDTWKKARIINFTLRYRPGGQLKYDKIDLLIQPEE